MGKEKSAISNFQSKVYALAKKVPAGSVTTYSAIAKKLGSSSRAVGNALRANPFAPIVPCHRVVKSDGTIGGFKGKTKGKAIDEKINLLKKEGIVFNDDKIEKKQIIL